MGTSQSRRVVDGVPTAVRIRPNGAADNTVVLLPLVQCTLPAHARRAMGPDGVIDLDAAWGHPRGRGPRRWKGPTHPQTGQPVPVTPPLARAAARWLVHGLPATLPLPARLLLTWLGCPSGNRRGSVAAAVALPGTGVIHVYPNSVGGTGARTAVAVPVLRRCQVPQHLAALSYVVDLETGLPIRLKDVPASLSDPDEAVYLDMDEAWGTPGQDWIGPVHADGREAVVTPEVLRAAAGHLRRYSLQGVRAELKPDTTERAFVEWLGCPVDPPPPEIPVSPFASVPFQGVTPDDQAAMMRHVLATDRDFVSVASAHIRARTDAAPQPPLPSPSVGPVPRDSPRQGATRTTLRSTASDADFYSGLVMILPNSKDADEVGRRQAEEVVLDSPCRIDRDAAFVFTVDATTTSAGDVDVAVGKRVRLSELDRPVDHERELVVLDMDELWGTAWDTWWGPTDADGTPLAVTRKVLVAHSVAERPSAGPVVAATVTHLRHWLGCPNWLARQAVPLFRLDDSAGSEAVLPMLAEAQLARPFVLDQGRGVVKVYMASPSGVCAVCTVAAGRLSVVPQRVSERAGEPAYALDWDLTPETAYTVVPIGARLVRVSDLPVPDGGRQIRAFQGDESRLLLMPAPVPGGAMRWATLGPGVPAPAEWVRANRTAPEGLATTARGVALAADLVFVADRKSVLVFHEHTGELLRVHNLADLLGAPVSGDVETELVPVCGAPFAAVLAGGPGWRNAVLLPGGVQEGETEHFGVIPTVEPGPMAWGGVLAAVYKDGNISLLCTGSRRKAALVATVHVRQARLVPWVPLLPRVTVAGPRAEALSSSPFVPGLRDKDRHKTWSADTRAGLRDKRKFWEVLASRQPLPPDDLPSPREGHPTHNPQKRRRLVLFPTADQALR